MILSEFARTLVVETAFTVLALARQLQAAGKDVVELEIGDSPFPSTHHAKAAGIAAIESDRTHYCPSLGLPEFQDAAAAWMDREFGVRVGRDQVVAAPGAKPFELFFCEAVINPGDGVLVFSPYFPTYPPNIHRRGGRMVLADLHEAQAFRPNLAAVERFLAEDPAPRAIFLNSPHNPTGGVATADDLRRLADLVRGRDVAIFSDEPYCHMVWSGEHHTILSQPGMFDQALAAYTFSKSYSMSGWRLGFAVGGSAIVDAIGKLINTSLSCVPPLVQLAGIAALESDAVERDELMDRFRQKVDILTTGLAAIAGIRVVPPAGTFYVFPNVSAICNRLGIQSHGLALYLLEAADDRFGIACLGGECFGAAGRGFLRFSCAEPNDRLRQALDFLPRAFARTDRVAAYLRDHPQDRLAEPYPEPPSSRHA